MEKNIHINTLIVACYIFCYLHSYARLHILQDVDSDIMPPDARISCHHAEELTVNVIGFNPIDDQASLRDFWFISSSTPLFFEMCIKFV